MISFSNIDTYTILFKIIIIIFDDRKDMDKNIYVIKNVAVSSKTINFRIIFELIQVFQKHIKKIF